MACCNGRRSAAARQDVLRAAVIATRPANTPVTGDTALLRYTGPNPLALRGPGSGLVYRLERTAHPVAVDRRDLATFLRTGLFEWS